MPVEAGTRTIRDADPATGELIAEIPCATAEDVERAVANAREARRAWAELGFEGRAAVLERVAERLDEPERVERLADLTTREMGKPLSNARAETRRLGAGLRGTLEHARAALAPTEQRSERLVTRLSWEPLGVAAVITPWNFPTAMANSLLVPALAAGNTVVFKPSEITPLTGEGLFDAYAAELPEGVISLVHGDDATGKALVAASVDVVAFVGSIAAGRDIMRSCAPTLKRLVLELGGKDPMIVTADADLDAAADFAVRESMRNSGQVCCSVERIYVERGAADAFLERVIERARGLKVGEGHDDDVFMGPMASPEQRDHVLRQLEDARQRGARIALGGAPIDGAGYFVQPTVVTDLDESMQLLSEETFGPVAAIRVVDDADRAVELANDAPFGLGATVWCGSADRGRALAARLESGMVGVNRGIGSAGDTPWAGVKQSGFGFLGSPDGYRQFTRPHSLSWEEPE